MLARPATPSAPGVASLPLYAPEYVLNVDLEWQRNLSVNLSSLEWS